MFLSFSFFFYVLKDVFLKILLLNSRANKTKIMQVSYTSICFTETITLIKHNKECRKCRLVNETGCGLS